MIHQVRLAHANSTADKVKFIKISKKTAINIWHTARKIDRKYNNLGRTSLDVLYVLVFDFLNYKNGRLDPSLKTIAHYARMSVSSVGRALKKLQAAGIIGWIRRCSKVCSNGQIFLFQKTNAYVIYPVTYWTKKPAAAPAPEAGTWGDHPSMDGLREAAIALRSGGGLQASVDALERDYDSPLSQILAKIGINLIRNRVMEPAQKPVFSGFSS